MQADVADICGHFLPSFSLSPLGTWPICPMLSGETAEDRTGKYEVSFHVEKGDTLATPPQGMRNLIWLLESKH